jgi:hypothetical protein
MFAQINVPPGELCDRITILQIKMDRITDEQKLAHVHTDLMQSLAVLEVLHCQTDEAHWDQLVPLIAKLRELNQRIWDIEDNIRRLEKLRDFGGGFIQTARSVYYTNDKRANVKRQINDLFESDIKEEKSYTDYL